MNKTTKGGIAAGAAAVLLLGGAGSLAYWTSSTTLNGGSITSGSLKLTDPACDGAWKYSGTSTTVNAFVPGDKVTKSCTFKITATGDNLTATLNTPAATFPAPTGSLKLTPTAVYTIGSGAAVNGDNTITSADNNKTVTAVITVDIPFGTKSPATGAPSAGGINENDMQLTTAMLNAITVTATQVKGALNTGSN